MNHIYLTDKVCVNPDATAIQKLWNVSYICKDIWNILNDEKRRNGGSYYKLKKILPDLKSSCDRLQIPSSQVLQEVVKSLNAAWRMYFTKRKSGDKTVKPPRFKSFKYFFTQKYPQSGTSFEIIGNTLRLAYGKNKKDWIEIKLPSLNYNADTVKNITVSYDKSVKRWYVCIAHKVMVPDSIEISKTLSKGSPSVAPTFFCPLPIAYNPYTRMPVHFMYFDPGCKTALTGIKTDGTIWEYDIGPLRELNFKHYMLIDKLKSVRDTKNRGSRQWRRFDAKIRNIYKRINGQSKLYLHKISNQILNDHPDVIVFYIGDWDKHETLADTGYKFIDRRINRQVLNNNPVMRLVEYLSYKAALQCKEVDKFNERGTSRTCSCCGYVYGDGLSPSVRTFKCSRCGFVMPRDINSTLNFLRLYQYAVWHGLRAIVSLSIARHLISPASGKNRRTALQSVVLNYQDARYL